MNKMLSIYYSKTSGEIYTLTEAPSQQGFDRFGQFADDMALILDIMYIENNDMVLMNPKMFKVVNGTIQIKNDIDINIINNN